MFLMFARPRSTSPLWLLSCIVVLLLTVFVALSTTSVLAVAYQLSGKVTDQAGTAIAGATVEVINPTTSVTVGTTTTTASGTYALSVESGTYNIRVTPPAGSQFDPAVVLNRSITATTIINFVLVPPAPAPVILSGQVKDGSGQGIAGVQLSLNSVTQTSDASGGYRFEVAPGQYSLSAVGFDQPNQPAFYTFHTQTPLALTQTTSLNIVLPFKRVTVHVQDANGNPAANARIETDRLRVPLPIGSVMAEGFSEYRGSDVVLTNASGDAVLWLFPTATTQGYTLTVTPPPPPPGTSVAVTTVSNIAVTTDRAVTITLPPPVANVVLSGQVKDGSGQGVAGVQLSLNSVTQTSDASGGYRFEVAPGQYSLSAVGFDQPNQPAFYTFHTQTPLALTQTMSMDIVLPFKRVTVHVQDANGNPAANARIETDRLRVPLPLGSVMAEGFSEYRGSDAVLTNASGDAVLWLFPTATTQGYTLTVTPPPPPPGTSVAVTTVSNIAVTADRAVTITLPPPVANVVLSGQVKDGSGQGVAGVQLSLNSVTQTSDASGGYRFEVAPGQYSLSAVGFDQPNQPAFYTFHAQTPLALTQTMSLNIVLPFKRVAVHVQDANGNPAANARIETDRLRVPLPLGNGMAEGFSEYRGSDAVVTNASGDAVLWLFPTATTQGYTLTVTPPAGTPFVPLHLPNITLTQDRSEIIVLQYPHAPPVTTATVTPAPNPEGMYDGPVTVSLAATADSGYTIAATYYTIDKGARQTYTGPFTISEAGRHTVAYWSVDTMGVTETTKFLRINMYRTYIPRISQ